MKNPSKKAMYIDPEIARQVFHYSDGNLYWKEVGRGNRASVGSIVTGTINKGYRVVRMRGRQLRVHRIIWAVVNGQNPTNELDHINGDTLDNRIENLRDVTKSENAQNRRKHRMGSAPGIALNCTKRKFLARSVTVWRGVYIGPRVHIGSFDTDLEAATAVSMYCEKRRQEALNEHT